MRTPRRYVLATSLTPPSTSKVTCCLLLIVDVIIGRAQTFTFKRYYNLCASCAAVLRLEAVDAENRAAQVSERASE